VRRSVPDEVGTVAAERRLFEETSNKFVFFDAVDVLLAQRPAPLDATCRRPTARRRRGSTRRHRGRRPVFAVDSVDFVTHLVANTATGHHTNLIRHVQTGIKCPLVPVL